MTVSQHAHYQNTETDTTKCSLVVINQLFTSVFPCYDMTKCLQWKKVTPELRHWITTSKQIIRTNLIFFIKNKLTCCTCVMMSDNKLANAAGFLEITLNREILLACSQPAWQLLSPLGSNIFPGLIDHVGESKKH